MIKKHIYKITLTLLLLLAALFRIFWLDKSPAALNWDETTHGYNAYSILQTGKDEFGKILPLSLRSFDDYKTAVYAYTIIPFVKIIGLNEYSVRLPSALSGIILILIIYFLVKNLLNQRVALVASFLITIEPWALHFSRAAFEANLALPFLFMGILLTVKSKFEKWYSLIGIFFLALGAYTYHSEKILLIPLLLGFIFLYKQNIIKSKKYLLTSLIFLFVLIFPMIYQTIGNKESLGRLSSTTIFKTNSNAKIDIFGTSTSIIQRYLSYYSPINLFVRGTPEPTQSVAGFGMFFNIEIIFWLIGLYSVFSNIKKHKEIVFLAFLFPIPAMITWNWFYPHRVLPLFVIFSIIVAIGLVKTIEAISEYKRTLKYLLILIIASLFINNFLNLATSFLFYMPFKEGGSWQHGMKQIISAINIREKEYEKVIFETKTAQPYIFVLFWTKYPPQKYQEEIITKPWINSLRKDYDFAKYTFRDVYWDKDKELRNVLLVGPESSLPLDKIKSNLNVDYVFDVTNPSGEILSRIVGIK